MNYTRKELIAAFAKWNESVKNNPDNVEPYDCDTANPENQADTLISFIEKSTPREEVVVTKTTGNTVTKS